MGRTLVAALVLATLGLGVMAVRHLREQPPPPPPAIRLNLASPPATELGSGDEALDAAISPDDRQIVVVATRAGTTTLWRRTFDSDRAETIPGTEGAHLPAWSPAGDAVMFFAGGRLKRISVRDGSVRELADAPSPAGVSALPDGTLLFAPESGGVIQALRDGVASDATTLGPGERGHVFPIAAGEDGSFVYTSVREDGRRILRLVRGGQVHDLTTTAGHGQLVGDQVLYVRDNVLLAQRLDEGRLSLQGRAVPVASGVGVTSAGRSLFSASRRVVLSAAYTPRARELAWFDWQGARTGTAGEPGDYWQARLSPDDRYAAVTALDPLLRTLDIDIIPTARAGRVESLTLALAADSDPVWAPDGRRVLFRSLQTGKPGLFTREIHEADAPDVAVPGADGDATPSDWRGATLLFHRPDPASRHDIWTLDLRSQSSTTMMKGGFGETDGRWSPDGAWLAFVSDESGRPDIYARGPDGERTRVSSAGGTRPRWSRDGRSIFFLRDSRIMRATLDGAPPARFAPAVSVLDVPGLRDFDVAHQRDALLVLAPVDGASATPVSVVVDWQSALAPTP